MFSSSMRYGAAIVSLCLFGRLLSATASSDKTQSSVVASHQQLAVAPQAAFVGQSFPLTSQTISSWIVTGADRAQLAATPIMILPAGSQVARNFESGDIAVNLDAGVVFGADPADWPVLEIGSAALVFIHNGDGGVLKLIWGDNEPITLPYLFKLDDNGRSVDPVQLTVAISGGRVAINTLQRTLMFPHEGVAGAATEIVFSAGGGSELLLTNFEVILNADEASNAGIANNSVANVTPDAGKTSFAGTPDYHRTLAANSLVDATATSDSTKKADITASTSGRKVGLVVFSPSAFRLGRADAIRKSAFGVAGSQK